jgi:hypothetical protein
MPARTVQTGTTRIGISGGPAETVLAQKQDFRPKIPLLGDAAV